jgi:hypothetical protein
MQTTQYPSPTNQPVPPQPTSLQKWLLILPWVFIALGIALRLVSYLRDPSLWNDEASLAANIVALDFSTLQGKLILHQAAPLGYLWLLKSLTLVLGYGEWVLRLPSLICAIAALFVAFRLAKMFLGPISLAIAMFGIATTHWLIYYSSELKQYASDSFLCLLLIWLLARYIQLPSRTRLCAITAVAIFGIWFSYPLVLCIPIVGLFLITYAVRHPQTRLEITLASILSIASCLAFYWLSIKNTRSNNSLEAFWLSGFPPDLSPAAFFPWLAQSCWAFIQTALSVGPAIAACAAVAAVISLVALLAPSRDDTQSRAAPAALAAMFAAALFAASLKIYPFIPTDFDPAMAHPCMARLHLWLLIPFILLCTFGLQWATQFMPRLWARTITLLMLGALLTLPPATVSLQAAARPTEIQAFRSLWLELIPNIQPGDAVLLQDEGFGHWIYYDRIRQTPVPPVDIKVFPRQMQGDADIQLLASLQPHKRLWVIYIFHPVWLESPAMTPAASQKYDLTHTITYPGVQAILFVPKQPPKSE